MKGMVESFKVVEYTDYEIRGVYESGATLWLDQTAEYKKAMEVIDIKKKEYPFLKIQLWKKTVIREQIELKP